MLKSRAFINLLVILSLLVQTSLYAGAPVGRAILDEPLLSSGLRNASQDARMLERHEARGEERLDLEMATLSSASSLEEDLEAASRSAVPPTVKLFPLSPEAEDFLDCYGLTPDMLRERDISFADFQALFDTDTSPLWNWGRFIAINRSFPHLLEAPFRGGKPVYPLGGMAPIANPKKRMLPAFIEAFTGTTGENLERVFKLAIIGFLGLDLSTASTVGQAVSQFWNDEETAVNHLLSFLRTPAGPYVIAAVLSLPFIWGIAQGILTARELKHSDASPGSSHGASEMLEEHLLDPAKHSRFKGTADYLASHHQTLWTHYLRPFLMGFVPFKEDAIAGHLAEMVSVLRWSTSVTPEEGRDILRAVSAVAQQRGIVGSMAADQLLEIVYGVNFRDFKHLLSHPQGLTTEDKERLLMYLEIRAKGLSTLREMGEVKARWSKRKGFLDGVEGIVQAIYAKSLLWYAAHSGSWTDPSAWAVRVFMLGLKAAKTWLFVSFFQAVVEAITEFIHCPNEFSDLKQGDIGPVSNTVGCFNEYVRIFNQIPGQPVSSLTALIPDVNFPGGKYALDLSNKGLTDATNIAEILNAFADNHVGLTAINLGGNLAAGTPVTGYQKIGEAIGRFPMLEELLFGGNNLEHSTQNFNLTMNTIEFLAGWQNKLSNLQILDLENNYIASVQQEGAFALANALKVLPKLTYLDLSGNGFGGENGDSGLTAVCQALSSCPQLTFLDFSTNGFAGSSTAFDTETLVTLSHSFTALPNLSSLSLGGVAGDGSANFTGWRALSGSFQFLPHLGALDLSYCGIDGNQIIILDQGLKRLSQLSALALNGNSIEEYNAIRDLGTIDLGYTLRHLTNLTSLNLNSNGLGAEGDAGVAAIGNALPFLRNLISLNLGADPDYSGNSIGYTGVNGTVAIGQGLHYLSNLQSLALDNNNIGGTSNEGIAAIAAGLAGIPHLQSFSFLPQSVPVSFTAASMLNNALKSTNASQLPVELKTVQDVQLYLETLSPNTTIINLAGCLTDPPAPLITALFQGLKNYDIVDLDLSQNQIGSGQDEGTIALGQSLSLLSRLKSLNLSFNAFGESYNQASQHNQAGLIMLGMSFPALSDLTFLNLSNSFNFAAGSNNGLGPFFQGMGSLTGLTTLDLSSNGLISANEVKNTLSQFGNLTYLDLSGNDLGYNDDTAVMALGQVLPILVRLRHLNLSQNDLGTTGDHGFFVLAQGIGKLRNLTYLDLSSNGPNNVDMDNQIGSTSDQGTVALGESFAFMPHLAYVDLSGNAIGSQGNNGTAAIGLGLKDNQNLKTLNLAGNQLGAQGPSGITVLLNSVVRPGLDLNIQGAVNVPWTTAANVLATLNQKPIAEACEQQKCFGSTTPQNTNTISTPMPSVGTRRLLSLEEVVFDADDSFSDDAEPSSFSLTRLIKAGSSAVSGWVSRLSAATKELVYDSFGDWVTKKLTDAAHEATRDNHAYFPNIQNPHVRDWPTAAVYLNTTSALTHLPALPAGH